MEQNICCGCAHNLDTAGMNCEYACVGVDVVADEGTLVLSCEDYLARQE